MKLNFWSQKAIEFAARFYIIIMVLKYIACGESFTWKKPLGGIIIALLAGMILTYSVRPFTKERKDFKTKTKRFVWWRFAVITMAETILIILLVNVLFQEPIVLKTLGMSLVTLVSLGCIFGILLQKFIFRKDLPDNSVLVSEDKSHK